MDKRKVSIRELETLVGEHVMGLNIAHDMKIGDSIRFHLRGNPGMLILLPQYAHDANATRVVIDQLRSEGYHYMFWDEDGGTKVAEFLRQHELPNQAAGQYDDGVVTCLAALATRGIYVEVE